MNYDSLYNSPPAKPDLTHSNSPFDQAPLLDPDFDVFDPWACQGEVLETWLGLSINTEDGR